MNDQIGKITFNSIRVKALNTNLNPTELKTITKFAGLKRIKMKTTERTKIELDLKDAFRLADILQDSNVIDRAYVYLSESDSQLINLLIKKLMDAEPEVEF